MTKLRVTLLAGAFALCPAIAHASEGWWEWLERLSGPGPFHGGGVGFRVACTYDQDNPLNSCFRDRYIKKMLVLRVAWLTSGDNERFADTTGDTRPVRAFVFNPVYLSRVHPTLDVGAGAGFIVFWGDGFDAFARPMLTPISVSFVPFGDTSHKWARVFQVRFEERYLMKGFDGARFGSQTTKYSTPGEFLSSVSLVFNFGGIR